MSSGTHKTPVFFKWLDDQKILSKDHMISSNDGFFMITESISSILISKGIETFPDREDRILECKKYFDDWFLFAVPGKTEYEYGLLKMREKEHELERGIQADGDTPGVTISFIAFDTGILKSCLEKPSAENRKKLGMEINRVVAYPKQNHHPSLERVFQSPAGRGALSDCGDLCEIYCLFQYCRNA